MAVPHSLANALSGLHHDDGYLMRQQQETMKRQMLAYYAQQNGFALLAGIPNGPLPEPQPNKVLLLCD